MLGKNILIKNRQSLLGIVLLAFLLCSKVLASDLKKATLFGKAIPKQVDLGEKHNIESRMVMQWGLIFVDVKINQHGPFRFLLDTGADVSILSYELVNTLNLNPLETDNKVFKTGHKSAAINTSFYEIEEVDLGKALFKKAPFVATNTASDDFQMLRDLDVMGILGANLFHDVVLTLDLPNNKIKMSQGEHFVDKHQHLLKPGNIVSLSKHFYIPVVKMKISQEGAHSEYDFLVDSGYNGFVKMPICFTQSKKARQEIVDYDLFKEPGVGFQSELKGSLTIGDKKIDNPIVKYTLGDCKEQKRWGLIGTRYLQYQTISIDQQQRLVFLH